MDEFGLSCSDNEQATTGEIDCIYQRNSLRSCLERMKELLLDYPATSIIGNRRVGRRAYAQWARAFESLI